MAERRVPNGGRGTATGAVIDPGSEPATPGGPSSPPDTGTGDAIPRTEHESILEQERRHRAGQERAHQREMAKLREEAAEIKAQLAELQKAATTGAGATAPIPQAVLDTLDPSNPRDRILLDTYQNQAQWTRYMREKEEADLAKIRRERQVDEVVDEEAEAGVPREALLAATTPEAVRALAERWRSEERIRTLEAEVAEMRKGRTHAEEAAQTAATRERQRLGATQVPTSTGSQPHQATQLEERREELMQEKTALLRRRGLDAGARVMAINRELAAIDATIQQRA